MHAATGALAHLTNREVSTASTDSYFFLTLPLPKCENEDGLSKNEDDLIKNYH